MGKHIVDFLFGWFFRWWAEGTLRINALKIPILRLGFAQTCTHLKVGRYYLGGKLGWSPTETEAFLGR